MLKFICIPWWFGQCQVAPFSAPAAALPLPFALSFTSWEHLRTALRELWWTLMTCCRNSEELLPLVCYLLSFPSPGLEPGKTQGAKHTCHLPCLTTHKSWTSRLLVTRQRRKLDARSRSCTGFLIIHVLNNKGRTWYWMVQSCAIYRHDFSAACRYLFFETFLLLRSSAT